jgi:hypothetical protein
VEENWNGWGAPMWSSNFCASANLKMMRDEGFHVVLANPRTMKGETSHLVLAQS